MIQIVLLYLLGGPVGLLFLGVQYVLFYSRKQERTPWNYFLGVGLTFLVLGIHLLLSADYSVDKGDSWKSGWGVGFLMWFPLPLWIGSILCISSTATAKNKKNEMAKRVLVIGATGHVGSYLVPRLVNAGFDVVTMSRGKADPYLENTAWGAVERITIDRAASEADGSFVPEVLDVKADIVIDMICFELESAKGLVEGLRGHVEHFLHTGTIWTHGTPVDVPVSEDAAKHPFGDYGIKKAAIEAYLLGEARRNGFPATILHPGHIVGQGWRPINPAGNLNLSVWQTISRGETLELPNFGLETLHHVHADDVATLFMAAISHWSVSVGQSFHSVSEKALTLRGYAEAMYRWFGHEPNLTFAPFDQWAKNWDTKDANVTWEHIARSPSCSLEKAKRLLDYRPRYTSLEAIQESVGWLINNGDL